MFYIVFFHQQQKQMQLIKEGNDTFFSNKTAG